jgi:hydroxyacylglutathione hydrolase
LLTHHHADHVGGVEQLVAEFKVPVYGPANETIPGQPQKLRGGDRVALPLLGLQFDVLDIPGHTAGHIAYVGHGSLFCGDTLFSAGCGRLFEGTAEQMHASLSKIGGLDPATRVFCGHEYTLANLRFAQAVEPNNQAVQSYFQDCRDKQQRTEPTLPSTLELEHKVNPFLRCHTQSVKQAAEQHVGRALDSHVAVFAAVRAWKDGFRA